MPVWVSQKEGQQFQHPGSHCLYTWGFFGVLCQMQKQPGSSCPVALEVTGFPPSFPLLIPLKDRGPCRAVLGRLWEFCPLLFSSSTFTCSVTAGGVLFLWRDSVPYLWNRDLDKTGAERHFCLFFFFSFFFCMRANWGKTKWWQVLGNIASFSNSKWKWHLENQKLHRRCLTLSLWSLSLTYVWGLECAWFCAMCWTCLRWFGEDGDKDAHFRDETIEACRG